MRVESIEPLSGERVEMTDTGEYWNTYERYARENWHVLMGDSLEPVYDRDKEEELEAAYQAFKAAQS